MLLPRNASALALAVILSTFVGAGQSYALDKASRISNVHRIAYDAPLPGRDVRLWRLANVRVNVSRKLIVSERAGLAPEADIVWQSERKGNRYRQVSAIMGDAALEAGKRLRGSAPVVFDIDVLEFHSPTNRMRAKEGNFGVHNITFDIAVVDANTGQVIVEKQRIEADLEAFTGVAAKALRREGQIPRVRVTNHLKDVLIGWMGIGKDRRRTFERRAN